MDHLRYYLGFNLVSGIGPARLARLQGYCGSLADAWHADAFELAAAGLESKASAALIAARGRLDLDAELERVAAAGVTLLCWDDPAYPRLLREIPAAPPLLYVRGTLTEADDWAIAVVGTRSPTTHGRDAALRFSGELARASVSVVSGLALGIDTMAHEAALDAGGRTLAVLGCGVDQPYPERNRRLAARIVEQGALISDYPLGTLPTPANFPARNRIVSGLSRAVLVVEAGQRSGALITVGFALEQGRDVFALPGPIASRQSVGCNQLIREGATLVTSAQELLDDMDLTAASVQREARSEIPDDPAEAAILQLLGYEPTHIDELGRAANLSAPAAAAALALLELRGLVRQAAPLLYVLVR
ncbi:DNA-processing protein DprA [Candidatus Viridilinea mediisalina]|uniref:DNA-protecting protein DprA n=1 Tax=Candidatus Viridilinea mediisalina TaxID=2024553 RepID=A0A2A6RE09_9CHLR|nr:DNA-processing protein DprA [Candidatus Viridilinea mediisalina]PDW01024.1 DNA-protecting protein DprA [Candidatus Viridilinea mediisalina]